MADEAKEAALQAAVSHMLEALEQIAGAISKEEAQIVAQEALEVVSPVKRFLTSPRPMR